MIPIELTLTNFMSYASMNEPLSFTSFRTAALCGANGHGKSTLLDAITWAVWGRARGTDKRGSGSDDLIRAGESFMAVEFVFELDGQRYRIARAREKTKSGTTRLDFSILEGENARSLNGETILKTQVRIDQTLRMDFDTFTNSAFILQGHADSFMEKAPTERKEILGAILGLSVYGELEERAKAKRRELENERLTLDANLSALEGELAQLPEYQAAFKKAEAEAQRARTRLEEDQKRLADLREKKAKRDAIAERLADLNRNTKVAEKDIATLTSQLIQAQREAAGLTSLLERAKEIQDGARKLSEARQDEESMAKLAAEDARVRQALGSAKGELAAKEAEVSARLSHLKKERDQLVKKTAGLPAAETELAELAKKEKELKRVEEERDDARERFANLRNNLGKLGGAKPALLEKLGEVRERVKTIEDADACPLCRKELAPEERKSLMGDLAREEKDLLEKLATLEKEYTGLTAEIEHLKTRGLELSALLEAHADLPSQIGQLKEKVQGAREAKSREDILAGEIREAERAITDRRFAPELEEKARQLENQLAQLAYDPKAHETVRLRLKELAGFERESYELSAARERTGALEQTIASLNESIEGKRTAIVETQEVIDQLNTELADGDAADEILLIEQQIKGLLGEERSALEAAAVAKGNIDRCAQFAEEKKELLVTREKAAAGVSTYSDLALAFSKNGIPALIIENAIPEIEEEANAILKRLSEGRMSIRFLTQKGRKSGAIVETLDLVVSDGELGERKYELFSGGEAFRINFAVRLALSKLLTRRAGARLELLVIDEGFGTQDEEGRDRLVEAIASVSSDFQKIIVITHLDELKEAFPARIEVVKKPGIGSVATVV